MTDAYEHKDVWTRRAVTFCVQVSRHTATPHAPGEGPNRWCVYAYLYPTHPHFASFDGDKIFQPAATALPLHAYPSLLERHRDAKGDVASIQVGADYHHLHDERFTDYATREDAAEVFRDAEDLFAWLSAPSETREPPPLGASPRPDEHKETNR